MPHGTDPASPARAPSYNLQHAGDPNRWDLPHARILVSGAAATRKRASTGRRYGDERQARARKRKRGDHGSVGAWENDTESEAVERAFRQIYATYEWLRDSASPFDTMTACRLQSPNWWRTARDALVAAWALLEGTSEPVASAAEQRRATEEGAGYQAQRVAAAIHWTIEAAVALRLPYEALQPAEAWAAGWSGVSRATTRSGDGVTASCRAAFMAAGVRSQREGCLPARLPAALDQAERALAVCYTERRSHH